jgi:hypothetical protein
MSVFSHGQEKSGLRGRCPSSPSSRVSARRCALLALLFLALVFSSAFAADFSMISGVESVKVTQDRLVEITVSKPLV